MLTNKEILSLDWKNVGRMLKYIWSNAKQLALQHSFGACCCLPDEMVYAWVRESYFLDDREAVMKERAEQAAAERRKSKRDPVL